MGSRRRRHSGQDISDRPAQFAAKPPHFDLGKSFDTFGPIGPFVVSTDELADRDALHLTGDIIFTGTPEGVGMAKGQWLADGDVITTTIDGLGTMTNHVVRIADPRPIRG